MFELASALELFALPRADFDSWYECQVVSLTQAEYSGLGGLHLQVQQTDCLPDSDLVVIPSFPVNQTKIATQIRTELLTHFQKGGRIISFCSGAFLLAELGLLQNRKAVTHWRYVADFQRRFPHIRLSEDVLYEYDGVIGCSAGSAAGIDLGIEVIRQDFGYDKANRVARRLVLPAHRSGGQAQYIEKAVTKTRSQLSETLDWAIKHLTSSLTVEQIANKANMTRRTFDRHFKQHYHCTAQYWLTEQKLDIAKTLLESTDQSVEKIALNSGFGSAVTLRHNFNKYLSISPTAYRETFSKSLG